MKQSNFIALICLFLYVIPTKMEAQTSLVINGPAGSDSFGMSVVVLTNGNYVVSDPYYDLGGIPNVGAVYLYDGQTHSLISTLTGSQANDLIGHCYGGENSNPIIPLSNGNYVVSSYYWDNGGIVDAGAATWCNGTTGINGIVSSSNSLVGSNSYDAVGEENFTYLLSNGNYVVCSRNWNGGRGAVTLCNGNTGTVGIVSSSNSLVGSTAGDQVGGAGIMLLSNGNFVVRSLFWDNSVIEDAGAVTWCDGTNSTVGIVSSSNSLVGSNSNDFVGYRITPLTNGNYVVVNHFWDNGAIVDAGAVTWCNGTTGTVGIVSSSNSLVGSSTNDNVGGNDSYPLSNGNYIVASKNWDNGAIVDAGAATWGNGTTGTVGIISSSNSLVGTNTNDQISSDLIIPLSNGNYVVCSHFWDNGGIVDVGAVTWGNGTTGTVGIVSSSNSLVGSTAYDKVGLYGSASLTNGNYVVNTPYWDNGGIVDVGAVTWCNGTTGLSGFVSSSNSLVGSTPNNYVGNNNSVPLSNGNYVVCSSAWDNGGILDAGAATWCNGSTSTVGIVSSSNSLVGTSSNDQVSNGSILSLSNGNYVVNSPYWDNGGIGNAGAVTWGNGTTGIVGNLSSSNSLVGSNTNDYISNNFPFSLSNGNYVIISSGWNGGRGAVTWRDGTTSTGGIVSSSNSLVGTIPYDFVGTNSFADNITPLTNGNYIVSSLAWDNGAISDAGAITWGCGDGSSVGTINTNNSVLGAADSIYYIPYKYNYSNCYFIVGKQRENKVVIFTPACSASANAMLSSATPTLCEGDAAIIDFNTSVGTTNYSWQQSTNGGVSWSSVSGTNSITTSITATLTDTCLYRIIYNYMCITDTTPIFTLTVIPTSSQSITQTACDAYTVNGQTYTTSGVYTQTLTNGGGCDSVLTLNLTINNTPDNSVIQNGTVLTANATGVSYQWVYCNGFVPILGEIAQTLMPMANGNYAVIVMENGCSDTSSCYLVTGLAVEGDNLRNQIKVYPNPTTGMLKIDLGDVYEGVEVRVYNLIGQELLLKGFEHGQVLEVEMPIVSGVYFVSIRLANGETLTVKVVKE